MLGYLNTFLVELVLIALPFTRQLCFHKCCRGLRVTVVHEVVEYELALRDDNRGQISRSCPGKGLHCIRLTSSLGVGCLRGLASSVSLVIVAV